MLVFLNQCILSGFTDLCSVDMSLTSSPDEQTDVKFDFYFNFNKLSMMKVLSVALQISITQNCEESD